MSRPVALIADARHYVGPALARELAPTHDLVLGDADEALVTEVTASGAAVGVVEGVSDLAAEDSAPALVAEATGRFGRLDAACAATGDIVIGRFTKASIEDLRRVTRGNVEAPMRFLQACLEPMMAAGQGQILLLTSASGARVTPGAPLYSATRAAANHLVRNVAAEVAPSGVQVNAVGTNYMDFEGFRKATGIDGDPERQAAIEAQVPMGRLGTMEELAAFCTTFLDGRARFTTGQFVAFAGGWA